MGLDADDPRPEGMAPRDAYAAIRSWYQANLSRFERDPQKGKYAREAKSYVASMPEPDAATPEQMSDAFHRVLTSNLEWAYHESDGLYKMAAYAEAGRG